MRQEDDLISSEVVKLRPLAAPDVLEFQLPDKHCCIVTDDGSRISIDLATHLVTRGWRVVVLRYFNSNGQAVDNTGVESNSLGQAPLVTLTSDDESHIRQQLDHITSCYGPIAAFIHVHPHFSHAPDTSVGFHPGSEQVLHQVFLTAKYLQPTLTAAARQPVSGVRACFMTVTQLDGGFGLLGERDIDVISGGLAGLTKTLSLEWPEVFCRAVDVSPDIGSKVVSYILTELSDPNRRYIEVGLSKMGRVTPDVA